MNKFLILKAVCDRMPIYASKIVHKNANAPLQIGKYISGKTYKALDTALPFWFVTPCTMKFASFQTVSKISPGAYWNGVLICEVSAEHKALTYTEWNSVYGPCIEQHPKTPMFTQFKVLRHIKQSDKSICKSYNDFMHYWSLYYKLPFLESFNHTTNTYKLCDAV